MSRVCVVTYEPTLSQSPAVPRAPLFNPANEDFDEALAQVAGSLVKRQARPVRARATESAASAESTASSVISPLIGTGAIATAAYRLVLSPPDEPKLRPPWYSRFPTP